MNQQQIMMLPGIQPNELALVQDIMKDMTEAQQQQFLMIYSGKRKDQQTMLILCLVGILGIAGIHRLVSGDVVLGIVYLLTCGFCFIGTIIDAVNIGSLTFEHNRKQAFESAQIVSMTTR